jgi:transcriptional regulator GlxA family with amidase domain
MPRGEEKKTIALVLYPGLTVFDLAGPLQVLSTMSAIAPKYGTVVVSERLEPIDTDIPGEMKVIPTNTFEEVPHPFALVVPGGGTVKAMRDEAMTWGRSTRTDT